MKMKIILLLVCTLNYFNQSVNSTKILGLAPSYSKSHTILLQALFKVLAERSHEVTLVSPYPLLNPVSNFRNIYMKDLKKQIFGSSGLTINDYLLEYNRGIITRVKRVYEFGYNQSRLSIEDSRVLQLLKSNETFDLVICTVFMNEVFFSIADHFKAPLIGFSPFGATEWINNLVGNPSPYAITPELFLGYTEHMLFIERLINTGATIVNDLWYHFLHLPKQEILRQKHLPHTKPLLESLKDVSLVLLNSHLSLSSPQALVPNMIEIGGFHISDPKPLPTDLQKTLDESKDGVIYFSMGTNFVSKDLPESSRKGLLEAFSKLKQTVLWKWEDAQLPGKSKNVKISTWYPQSDLLAHPNVKVFITHGGLLSTTEAVSRGVPLIGIPIFADQILNMAKAESFGFGLTVGYQNITYESIIWALTEVLNNPKFTENVKQRSQVLNDRIVAPIDEAVYWVEYVLRHKGASHLQSARKDLNIFQYLLLDIVGFLIVILISVVLIIYFLIKKIFQIFRSIKKRSTMDKKKQ